jgi:phage tail sheath protein FI
MVMSTFTCPGVYIQEIPSGVRTITGVSTSITVFIGWASKGPVDKAQRIFSWQDFERYFGGLDSRSLLGYSVASFFANGGTDAYIIRLVNLNKDKPEESATSGTATIDNKITLTAKNHGEWGNHYRINTKKRTDDPKRFQLQVLYFDKITEQNNKLGALVESFENLSMDQNDSRFVINVINEDSTILNATLVGNPTTPPDDPAVSKETGPALTPLTKGSDGIILKPNDGNFEKFLINEGEIPLLNQIDLFNILCVPGESTKSTISFLEGYCRKKRAFLIVDSPEDKKFSDFEQPKNSPINGITGEDSINAAFYFPWLKIPDPLTENRSKDVPPCGFMAGIYSRTDANRGVFKAPAGIDASLTGVTSTTETINDNQNGVLNQQGVNCIRNFPVYGTVAWGARTLRGNDEIGSEWKYIPVRRLALFIEESLFRGTKWVVFEPNDEPLWSQIRLNIGAFMHNLFRQGAFQGSKPQDAYFVKCDKETTTQNDINLGIVNIIVGFAPLKPAEFVVIKIQQMAGQIQT